MSCLDLNEKFQAALDSAEEYGNDMESMYNESNEYDTSKFESLSMFLNSLVNELKYVPSIQFVKIPRVFVDEIEQHDRTGCKCASRSFQKFIEMFPNVTIQYI